MRKRDGNINFKLRLKICVALIKEWLCEKNVVTVKKILDAYNGILTNYNDNPHFHEYNTNFCGYNVILCNYLTIILHDNPTEIIFRALESEETGNEEFKYSYKAAAFAAENANIHFYGCLAIKKERFGKYVKYLYYLMSKLSLPEYINISEGIKQENNKIEHLQVLLDKLEENGVENIRSSTKKLFGKKLDNLENWEVNVYIIWLIRVFS